MRQSVSVTRPHSESLILNCSRRTPSFLIQLLTQRLIGHGKIPRSNRFAGRTNSRSSTGAALREWIPLHAAEPSRWIRFLEGRLMLSQPFILLGGPGGLQLPHSRILGLDQFGFALRNRLL